MNTKITAMLMAICATTSISAEETRQHGSHAHGLGELNIATEGNELIIEFISPSANIVGFEYSPGNSEETESVKKAQESLKQAESLFELSVEAACELEHVNIESALLSENETHANDDAHEEHEEHADEDKHEEHEEHADEDEHEEHEEHADEDEHEEHEEHADEDEHEEHADEDEHEEHEEHADEDEHEEHEEHADEDEHEEHDNETHSEFHAHYEFHCGQIEQLTEINVNVFTVFPLTESLNVQLLTTSAQSQMTLNKDNTLLNL